MHEKCISAYFAYLYLCDCKKNDFCIKKILHFTDEKKRCGAKLSVFYYVGAKLSVFIMLVPNCPGAKLSGAKLSWCQIVLVPNCPLLLSWCQIVRFYYLGAKLSALLSWCQIVRCQIVRCQIVRCQIVLQSVKILDTLQFVISNWSSGFFNFS